MINEHTVEKQMQTIIRNKVRRIYGKINTQPQSQMVVDVNMHTATTSIVKMAKFSGDQQYSTHL